MKTFLDGRLHSWLDNLGTIQRLSRSGLLATDLSFLESNIIDLIKTARKAGDNWLWSYTDIHKEKGEKEWQLPSVDIAGYFELETNNELEDFFKKKKIDLCCDWDTESSAWYPRFKNIEDAERCIDVINELFDSTYIKTNK